MRVANVQANLHILIHADDIATVCMLIELVCLRDGVLSLTYDEHCSFDKNDFDNIISHICSS